VKNAAGEDGPDAGLEIRHWIAEDVGQGGEHIVTLPQLEQRVCIAIAQGHHEESAQLPWQQTNVEVGVRGLELF
jgi:hypothetical protein